MKRAIYDEDHEAFRAVIREFIAKPAPMRHLYEIHTSLNRRW